MSAVTNEIIGTNVNEKPGRTAARRVEREQAPGTLAAAELAASGALDGLFAQIDSGELELTGDGGFIPALIKDCARAGSGCGAERASGLRAGRARGVGVRQLEERLYPEDGRDPGR